MSELMDVLADMKKGTYVRTMVNQPTKSPSNTNLTSKTDTDDGACLA